MKQTLFPLVLALLLLSCGGGKGSSPAPKESAAAESSDTLEVLYFHGKQRCVTCNAIESLTRETVDALADPTVVMKIVDLSNPANEALADRYEVAWSSLVLHRNPQVENLTEMAFGYAKRDPETFKKKLTEAIHDLKQLQ